jgi:hypothetical protein
VEIERMTNLWQDGHSTPQRPILLGLTLLAVALVPGCDSRSADEPSSHPFAWPTNQGVRPPTVGGHSHGVPVAYAPSPCPQWTALQAAGPGLARDRAAILALCGEFRIDFDFQELVSLHPGSPLATPYQSWATERIFVLDDEPDRISLQHQLVMVALDQQGRPTPAEVAKHWRQEWVWQGDSVLRYAGPVGAGSERWHHEHLDPARHQGEWVWTVWGIEDGPRYASIGSWHHDANSSIFQGDETWRPLPRREKTTRKDYQVLVGSERIVIAPDGWVMLQENGKLKLGGAQAGGQEVLAREIGVERYQRIAGFDWHPGVATWTAEEPFWTAMRATWAEVLTVADPTVAPPAEGGSITMALASEAAAYGGGDKAALERARALIRTSVTSGSPKQ